MRLLLTALIGSALLSSTVLADHTIYNLRLTGDQEFPGPGDMDGLATGPISLNPVSGEVVWNFDYTNIASPTAMHIHTGAAGVSGGVLISLGTSGTPGNLMGSLFADPSTVASIVAAPENFYVNIHNGDFGPGAIRGQVIGIPEPSSAFALSAVSCRDWSCCTSAASLVVETTASLPGTPTLLCTARTPSSGNARWGFLFYELGFLAECRSFTATVPATIHIDRLTGHKAVVRIGQKQHRSGDVFRRSPAPHQRL